MKKNYISPAIDIIRLHPATGLLAGSITGTLDPSGEPTEPGYAPGLILPEDITGLPDLPAFGD